MPTFNKHGEINDQNDEFQQLLRQKETGIRDVPEKQIHRPLMGGAQPARRMFPPVLLIVAGAVLVFLLVLGGIGVGMVLGRTSVPALVAATQILTADPTDAARAGDELASAPTPAVPAVAVPAVAVPAVAPTLVPSMPNAEAEMVLSYTGGVNAYTTQDWKRAVDLFQAVYSRNEAYLDIAEKLSATYYNWGVQLLGSDAPAEALDKFNAALSISPTHQPALAQQQRLVIYLDALSLRDQKALRAATVKLEELRGLQADFLDSTTLLYDTYLAYGEQLEAQRNEADARRIYTKAVGLPVPDTSAAQAGLRRLTPPPTPVKKKLRFSVLNYNDSPGCISIRITGIVPSGWYFSVDGLKVTGRFDSGGNARACGIGSGQEVTITVVDGNGRGVVGGTGVPSKGSAIMVAAWK